MAEDAQRIDGDTIKHPARAQLVTALWHSSEPLSARRYRDDYTEGELAISAIEYHLRTLESGGVVALADERGGERFYVIAGANASEAVRGLGLTDGRSE